MEMTGHIKISGIGAYLPDERVSSDDLMREAKSEGFGVPEEFLRRFSGIEERRFSAANEKPSTLAIAASRVALSDAGIDGRDIDQVIFCGIDRDFAEPATAHHVAHALGADRADCFDLSNACHGIMSGMSSANGTIGIGAAENILLCTGETPSEVTFDILRQLKGTTDRELFKKLMGALTVGDAGGAIVVSKAPAGERCKWMNFNTKSKYKDYCHYRHTSTGVEFEMQMSKISTAAVEMHQEMIGRTFEKLGWEPDSISSIFCHQAGAAPHKKMAKLARQPIKKAPITYKLLGNLTSATIPINMHLNRPERGDKILLMGVGSGLAASQVGMIF